MESSRLSVAVEELVDLALDEDIGGGDVTTRLAVDPERRGGGRVVARQRAVVSGTDVFAAVMLRVDPRTAIEVEARDGDEVSAESEVLRASGAIASLLTAERVALNFLQRLSGVATLTRELAGRLPGGAKTRIADTRKTTPGMRELERRAVRHGGGFNHRADLAGGVLIKENHAAAAGSLSEAIRRCRDGAPHPLRIEAEVRDERELREALDAGADAVLLDNMDDERVARCAEIVGGRALVEVSGGIDADRIAALAAAGADVISIGALTHSAPAADMSFLIDGGD
ncbi:MAG: carboxylating nicotinate-nucleotide diphosphorylase [Polyangia bacterium]